MTGQETEPYEIVSFKLYKSQLPAVEQALETAAFSEPMSRNVGFWERRSASFTSS